MEIINYSPAPHKPCIILKWPNVRILLDCPLDITPFFSYLPHVYQSARLKNAPPSRRFNNLHYLKDINNRILVEGVPEIHHVSTDALQMSAIDAILVSNFDSLIALPFYTEGTGFRGKVFMTDIGVQLGRLLMEEMIEYFERIDFGTIDEGWKLEEICTKFPNPPFTNPTEWRKFYTHQEMSAALSKINTLSFNQTIDVLRVQITAISSAHNLGSANWTIRTENERIGYLTASSETHTNSKKIEKSEFRTCDTMIVTNLKRIIDYSPQAMGQALLQTLTETLKKGGNCLIPMSPIGPIYEILEAVSAAIDNTNGIPIDTPIYFISPIAKKSLAVASISAEWMSETRRDAVMRPEEPFNHMNLIKANRLRIYDSLYGAFSKEYKSPCIMFTGHSSLRIGDAAHMIEVWGNDPKNSVILTDPDLNYDDVIDPFRNLPIRFIYCPMDFRLDFLAMQNLLIDVKPKSVICPPQYLKPIQPGRPDTMLIYGLGNIYPMSYDEPILLSKLTKSKKPKMINVKIHPEIIKNLKFKQHPTQKNLAIAPISCYLSCYDDDFQLVPESRSAPVARRKFGKINVDRFMRDLRKKKLDCSEIRHDSDFHVIKVHSNIDATITVSENGRKIKIQAGNQEKRQQIQDILKLGLTEDDGIPIFDPGNVKMSKRWLTNLTRGVQPQISSHAPPIPSTSNLISNHRIFDPEIEEWHKKAAKFEDSAENLAENVENTEPAEKIEKKLRKNEICEENRTDGHAPIKWALEILAWLIWYRKIEFFMIYIMFGVKIHQKSQI
ncbi:unnamed protein product [Caenorhabditis angaria]|uniref:Beta-Casp domain-containing protein n=1 Tax=Caenorhabditis angaria TaxID=860376 RepID=A0A9P1N4U2_9PELO|nr:unnamed protein product [Caenorhabditis angaria]